MTHAQRVLLLYKSILKLHRGLPQDLRAIGDEYLREEFKKHKTVPPQEAATFICEWAEYALTLTKQLGVKGLRKGEKIGKPLAVDDLDKFREEQLAHLYDLMQETLKPAAQDKGDG